MDITGSKFEGNTATATFDDSGGENIYLYEYFSGDVTYFPGDVTCDDGNTFDSSDGNSPDDICD